ncbi:nitroreductase family deazaflavin-dependent oxidoreductase [Frankia sp. CNm7]|uniref:Nitroreductase family deazaflavin-dependent oxidoreductase n=1 Tax=Frankia nepalensis TaxID=1836974 RepID=A0A937RNX4_9ACTN|nr:nitroreductase family deazaflavin-dependent oxidoreductase [Frankia nepalensis]MBL7497237.1 nitroreductase family deazaflavin-dependent oxidoreductase [Frankia nepalensis]MBL7512939.1 nitroreductase family deazaflavin-dependent oxidoreductase [Frankia nepalensis]MBL7524677.1 nitroreductase family deazaflavin-dependent oxidoreductase [Frankia nepalensis]MBL7633502.1 nitroreductase family deazaflavin-dependent oxidoreductase [Frankia nepalensis]
MAKSTAPSLSPTNWVADHTQRYLDSGGENGHLWYGPNGELSEGVPTLLLTTTGRRSGQPRRTALIYGQDGGDYVIVASVGGAPKHPLWYLNLTADPAVTVQVGADVFEATARVATPDEKARLWPRMVEVWPPYADYQKRTDRDIPVVLLTRAS